MCNGEGRIFKNTKYERKCYNCDGNGEIIISGEKERSIAEDKK